MDSVLDVPASFYGELLKFIPKMEGSYGPKCERNLVIANPSGHDQPIFCFLTLKSREGSYCYNFAILVAIVLPNTETTVHQLCCMF